MSIERLHHPAVNMLCGQGLDLPSQAARTRATWLPVRDGRPPALLIALLWGRDCTDRVRDLDAFLDGLLADCCCTPAEWSETQAVRQVLAAFNLQLFRQRQSGRHVLELNAGLLLVQGDEAQFLQAGAIGLRRYQRGEVHSWVGREGLLLGIQAELALVQYRLTLNSGDLLLLAPQPLLELADLQGVRAASAVTGAADLPALLGPLLQAPGAAALLQAGEVSRASALSPRMPWPVVRNAQPGLQLDGWTLLVECPFGPVGRLFRATDPRGREALLWLAEQPVDEVFRQREWALRSSLATGLPHVVSSHQPRQHAFWLLQPRSASMRSLSDRITKHGPMRGVQVLALIEQLIAAVRGLQRRGMQGLWLDPRAILLDDDGHVLLLPEQAALVPGVPQQSLPPEAIPLAPEARAGQALDGRADQFALAALAYWLCSGRWPDVARPDADARSIYVPLAQFGVAVPLGWDGVLARALAPKAVARFEALSEFQQALRKPLMQPPVRAAGRQKRRRYAYLGLFGLALLLLALALWLSL
ncbi:protein kinase [Pseudomonas sp. TMP25]|uniref:protein kinase n=1 Tax=Pseudomonas sp. TMP25 TaxID=3136561 RepID=UPI003101AA2B